MNRAQAEKVAAIFGELIDSGQLNYTGRYHTNRHEPQTFSPIGYLLFQAAGFECPYAEESTYRIDGRAMEKWKRLLSYTYWMTVDEAQIIQDEWLLEQDTANLIRMPMTVREED